MERIPVVAAIPNYNMASNLGALVGQLVQHDYERIVVLDDASTDTSREVVAQFSDPRVIFVPSVENTGAGAARNRIIPQIERPSIIHFIDADMDLETPNVPEIAQELFDEPDIAFIGGLVRNVDGGQFSYNYGPHVLPREFFTSKIHDYIYNLPLEQADKADRLRARFRHLLRDRVDTSTPPERTETFWTSEANMLIPSDVLERFGGFNERLREHEIIEFSIRTHHAGLRSWFDPSFSAIHRNLGVREYNRGIKRQLDFLKIIKMVGPITYLKTPHTVN